jgi:hypothetical protein
MPAVSAASLPKLRVRSITRTRSSLCANSTSCASVSSLLPSFTHTISNCMASIDSRIGMTRAKKACSAVLSL